MKTHNKPPIILEEQFLEKETYDVRIEIEEMPDGTWQVREKRIYTYTNPLAARNKMESYIYKNMDKKGK